MTISRPFRTARTGTGKPDAVNPQHILSHRADLRIANCRFLIDGKMHAMYAVRAVQSPHVDVRNCQFLGPWNFGVEWTMVPAGRMSVDNSLFSDNIGCLAITYAVRDLADARVAVTWNTFVAGGIFGVMVVPDATGAPATVPVVQVDSSRNVWDGEVFLALTYGLADQEEVNAFDDASVLRGWLSWRDQNNLYGSGHRFIRSVAFVGASSA